MREKRRAATQDSGDRLLPRRESGLWLPRLDSGVIATAI